MWFLPLLVVGAIAVAVAKRSKREAFPPSRQLTAASVGPPGTPGPISVLGEILRVGETPPPMVILCAIAEAQAIGRNDLASDIAQVFVAPIVKHHERVRARAARPISAQYERGSCAVARAPRHAAEGSCYAAVAPPFVTAPPSSSSPNVREQAGPTAVPAAPSVILPAPTEDDISALLNADPRRFMDLVSRTGTFSMSAPPSVMVPPPPPATTPVPASTESPTVMQPEAVAQMQDAAGLPEAADQTRALAPGSPIHGVSDGAWRNFVVLLARESPQFASSRHVGQFRQRRERLSELGIDPSTIANSAHAQRAALDADLADAHNHAAAGGVLDEHLGRALTIPGRDAPETITLSGLLGVIQCAGLDGAVGWLERPNDRKRYPHTTQAFLHTNGVF